jgi:hypothetical protein
VYDFFSRYFSLLFFSSKSGLAQLRKKTGYSLSICKKALRQAANIFKLSTTTHYPAIELRNATINPNTHGVQRFAQHKVLKFVVQICSIVSCNCMPPQSPAPPPPFPLEKIFFTTNVFFLSVWGAYTHTSDSGKSSRER